MKNHTGDAKSPALSSQFNPGPGPQAQAAQLGLKKLSLEPSQAATHLSSANPLKRPGEISGQDQPRLQGEDQSVSKNRKTRPGEAVSSLSDFNRTSKHGRQLFNPSLDSTSFGKGAVSSLEYESKSSLKPSRDAFNTENDGRSYNQVRELTSADACKSASQLSNQGQSSRRESIKDSDPFQDTETELLLQPETKPISHEQLVVEVKGIYTGLVMVENKCIDLDEKQTLAAQEKDPDKKTNLTQEQYSALIALHKTLLHEHHDFFLASQHPSASPALSRLAAKYSMPARMWRHGIHAFLEVLRHRLPESLDHMLAFIIIAYSMMALLYETVPSFEDTWVECLGDLGRYRMAIEDDDEEDRVVWSGVARFWYTKASDKSPKVGIFPELAVLFTDAKEVGRLYHHLAILAPSYTINQLSLYGRSLTCIIPFASAKGSIMTLFQPVLESQEGTYNRSAAIEKLFIKAHGLQFLGNLGAEFEACVSQLLDQGLFEKLINRTGSRFKEIGVMAALSSYASVFEYGAVRSQGGSRSILRLAYEEDQARKEVDSAQASEHNGQAPRPIPSIESLTPEEARVSKINIASASGLAFGLFLIGLQRPRDKNVYPMLHAYFVIISSFCSVPNAIWWIQQFIPWSDIATFLNCHATAETMTARVTSNSFPGFQSGIIDTPLAEDFALRGQWCAEDFFPANWFSETKADDDERTVERPSMAPLRLERILYSGCRIASHKKWLTFDEKTMKFSATPYAQGLARSARQPAPSAISKNDVDSVMSGMDESDDEPYMASESPPMRSPSIKSSKAATEREPDSPRKAMLRQTPTILKRESKENPKGDVDMTDAKTIKQEPLDPRDKPVDYASEWLKGENTTPGQNTPSNKFTESVYATAPERLDIINILDTSRTTNPDET